MPASASAWRKDEPLATMRQTPSPLSDLQKKALLVSTAVR